MPEQTAYERAMDYAVRPDPYERYAKLRQTKVERQKDGTFVVSTYADVQALFHDPRVSSDLSKRNAPPKQEGKEEKPLAEHKTDLSEVDPPKHDVLRRLAMRQFGPPHKPRFVFDLRGTLAGIVDRLVDGIAQNKGGEIDLIERFAYPFPVAVICKLLGIPDEDKSRIEQWTHALSNPGSLDDVKAASANAFHEINGYMAELIEKHRKQPGDDMISGMLRDDGPEGRMDHDDLVATASLLLSAGHETTVNLIGNGMLLLLRRPDLVERMVSDNDFVVGFVEELLRCESPVQFLHQRSALADVAVSGTTIPKGSPIMLMLGAANRDPDRFPDADRFDPGRTDNQHLGFGSGQHNCFGAPLARVEAQIAFPTLFRRLVEPKLVVDPPPYRQNPMVRGPSELKITVKDVRP